jgi:Bardet-Biedl syndrome 2 protein
MVIWLNNNFIFTDDLVCDDKIDIAFVALRTNKPLFVRMETNGQVCFKTDDMELAGLLVQSLLTYLNISDMQSSCDFPDELEILQQVLVKVNSSYKFTLNLRV